MPLWMTSVLSALVLTYLLSRVLLRLLDSLSGPTRLGVAHVGSWLLLTAAIGFTKAYVTSFAYQKAAVLIVPQLLWLCIDLLRGLGSGGSDYGNSTRGSRAR